jgi:hypothetical protein
VRGPRRRGRAAHLDRALDGCKRSAHAKAMSNENPMSTETVLSPAVDLRRAVIRTVHDAEALHAKVLSGAECTATWLHGFAGSPLELLTSLRFQTVGHDPLT